MIFVDIGKNARRLRIALGLSQEEVAFRSNLSGKHLQSMEYSCENPTMDTLVGLANAFQVGPWVLLAFSLPDDTIYSLFHGPAYLPDYSGPPLPVCEIILLLRKSLGLTQKQLSAMANVCPAHLRDIEHGCANVSLRKLNAIADAFGIPLLKLALLTTPESDFFIAVNEVRSIVGLSPVSLSYFERSDPFV